MLFNGDHTRDEIFGEALDYFEESVFVVRPDAIVCKQQIELRQPLRPNLAF